MTLYAPDITCDHCVGTIESVAATVPGVRFLHGDPNARDFVVEVERGAALDEFAVALSAEGYPLGEAPALPGAGRARLTLEGAGTPGTGDDAAEVYAIERTEAGARIETDCPCGCRLGFDLDRANGEPTASGCCCDRQLLVAPDAGARLRAALPDRRVAVTAVTMPWGQPMEVALAEPAETQAQTQTDA